MKENRYLFCTAIVLYCILYLFHVVYMLGHEIWWSYHVTVRVWSGEESCLMRQNIDDINLVIQIVANRVTLVLRVVG